MIFEIKMILLMMSFEMKNIIFNTQILKLTKKIILAIFSLLNIFLLAHQFFVKAEVVKSIYLKIILLFSKLR